jgi:hypothetical protein
MASTLKKVPGWLTRVLMPEVAEIKGEQRATNAKLDALDVKIDARFSELKAELRTLETKVDVLPDIAILKEQVKDLQRQRS